MREDIGLVLSNDCIALDTYKMEIKSDLCKQMKPGQFVNIKVNGFILRRPISINSINEDSYTIIYKVVGEGTEVLKEVKVNETINALGPLGSDFKIHEDQDNILIVGGGVGVPPLYEVAKRYRALNKDVAVVLGFNDKQSVFFEEEVKLDSVPLDMFFAAKIAPTVAAANPGMANILASKSSLALFIV